MRHPRITIAAVVIAIGAAAGGLGIAAAAGGASASYPSRVDPSRPRPVASSAGSATTVHTAKVSVDGKTEVVLVDAQGEPLYTFKADSPTASHVTGQLATLWPPLVESGTPTASGVSGKLTLVSTRNGSQVAYNGQFLYSFVDDKPGHVTGQGVQDFFVATPTTRAEAHSSASAAPATRASMGTGYGY
jgi:predicted lipoprotein with Yx(FWY)xxD motif